MYINIYYIFYLVLCIRYTQVKFAQLHHSSYALSKEQLKSIELELYTHICTLRWLSQCRVHLAQISITIHQLTLAKCG